MSSENTVQNVATAISVVQLMQAGLALLNAAKQAIADGKTEVPAAEIVASIDARDDELQALREAIVRAEAEGR